ncbi:hypothetical protein K474DRAFT_818179 [Panus rudis PR-1116 ss-1]|nr:hypothetical protein K474DRAFT_818179 [Panus rudis PR-1116 ss-1]
MKAPRFIPASDGSGRHVGSEGSRQALSLAIHLSLRLQQCCSIPLSSSHLLQRILVLLHPLHAVGFVCGSAAGHAVESLSRQCPEATSRTHLNSPVLSLTSTSVYHVFLYLSLYCLVLAAWTVFPYSFDV